MVQKAPGRCTTVCGAAGSHVPWRVWSSGPTGQSPGPWSAPQHPARPPSGTTVPVPPPRQTHTRAALVQRTEGPLPGDLVRAGHGDQLLAQQDAVPRLHRAWATYGHCPLPGLDLRAQVPPELPSQVLAAAH